MPSSLLIEAVSGAGPVPTLSGNALQHAVLSLVGLHNPDRKDWLHSRRYSLARIKKSRGGAGCVLRLASFEDDIVSLLEPLASAVANGELVRIPGMSLCASGVRLPNRCVDPWVAHASIADLVQCAESAASSPTLSLEFATATFFEKKTRSKLKRDEPLPSPANVFGGLADRWNEVVGASYRIPDARAFRLLAGQDIAVSFLEGRTATLESGFGGQTGFVGRVAYRHVGGEPDEVIGRFSARVWIHLMAEAAFYLGLGAKTAMGFGLSRKV